jgi:putative alpha-1,2-mannosidase
MTKRRYRPNGTAAHAFGDAVATARTNPDHQHGVELEVNEPAGYRARCEELAASAISDAEAFALLDAEFPEFDLHVPYIIARAS